MRLPWLFAVMLASACSSSNPPEPHKKPAPTVAPPRDAGTRGVTTISGFDPASGMHLDDDGAHHAATPPATPNARTHPIDVTLRSSPPGAEVAVDGTIVGTTPAYWSGEADGQQHEFIFVLAGHAVARYRFVPVTSGVIHARLEPISEEPAAGAGEEERAEGGAVPGAGSVLVNPPPAPVAKPDATGPSAPPTVITPAPDANGNVPGLGPQP